MNLNYSQSTGAITQDDSTIIATGWAGKGGGKNNPAMQNIKSTGPLPQGVYSTGPWQIHPRLGPLAARLIQISGETYGRDEFFIHGPSSKNYGQESKGCIIVPRKEREKVAALLPTTITVTA